MKDFKKGLSFGMGIVNAGQRAVSEEPELVVVSTPGSFRMTAQVSKALGIAHGEYVMFINNCANIDNAIINKVPEVVAFCEEQGLDIDYPNAKERILTLSDVAVKETLNKKTDTEVLNKVLSGEISTSQQIKLARKNISRALEIDEAEILDNIDKVVFTVSMEMINDLEKKINKIKKSINKNLGMELKSYHKLERIIEILKEVK
jgi:vacuolar-type H+-ATPase subunit H